MASSPDDSGMEQGSSMPAATVKTLEERAQRTRKITALSDEDEGKSTGLPASEDHQQSTQCPAWETSVKAKLDFATQ